MIFLSCLVLYTHMFLTVLVEYVLLYAALLRWDSERGSLRAQNRLGVFIFSVIWLHLLTRNTKPKHYLSVL